MCFLSEATFQHIVMLLSVEEDLSSIRREAEKKLPMNKSDSCPSVRKSWSSRDHEASESWILPPLWPSVSSVKSLGSLSHHGTLTGLLPAGEPRLCLPRPFICECWFCLSEAEKLVRAGSVLCHHTCVWREVEAWLSWEIVHWVTLSFCNVFNCVFYSAHINLNFPQDQIPDICLASHLAHMQYQHHWRQNKKKTKKKNVL